MAETYWNKFRNLNYDNEVIEACGAELDYDNMKTVKQVSLLLMVIIAILTTFYLIFDNDMLRNIICVAAGLFMVWIYIVSSRMIRNKKHLNKKNVDILIGFFSLVCFGVAIYLGTFAAGDEMAVPSVWMFFFIILIFNRLPLQNLFIVTVAGIAFGICSYLTKRPFIFEYDMIHAFTSAMAAIFMAWFKSRLKVENIVTLRKLEKYNMEIRESLTEKEKTEEILRYRADVDELTGLYKKKVFELRVSRVLEESDRKLMHAFVCIDIDDFKRINDKYGHLFGDQVLKNISERIKRETEGIGFGGRFGGDEFFLFFEGIESKLDVKRYLDNILQIDGRPIYVDNIDFHIFMSAGVSLYPRDGDTFEKLFEQADRDLYEVKNSGKGRYSGIW